ncbi:MAG: hypothetical protein IJ475_00260 [Bacilli bacterium]|nr:hypothetical protein [Bacilli bacterium]
MITTFTGPMHGGKSASMIEAYAGIWNKERIMCFKPSFDTRDGDQIKSGALVGGIDSIVIEKFEDILDYYTDDITNIFIDEAQFIKGNVSVLSYLSIAKDVDIYIAGLNMTSEQEPFMVMPYILAISDNVVNCRASCLDCGREATYTYYEKEKNAKIVVGNEDYVSLCTRCLNKRLGDNVMKLIMKKEEN